VAFTIPRELIHSQLVNLNTSRETDGKVYWHIHLQEGAQEELAIVLPKKKPQLPLKPYVFKL
jgi:hypothetical protein